MFRVSEGLFWWEQLSGGNLTDSPKVWVLFFIIEFKVSLEWILLTLTVLNFWIFTSYCTLKPLWLGMGEVVPARSTLTLHPPSPPTGHQLSWLALYELLIDIVRGQTSGISSVWDGDPGKQAGKVNLPTAGLSRPARDPGRLITTPL